MSALVSLDNIASSLCSDIGDSVMRHKFRITRYLLEAYSELHLYVSHDFDVRTEVIGYASSVPLPCDFVYETKVGALYNGCLAILSMDNNLQPKKMNDTECCDYLNSVWGGAWVGETYPFYNAYRGGSFLGELYGLGRGVFNSGTYRIDKKEGVIHIGSHIPRDAEIVIEYKSDGLSEGLKLVPTEMRICLQHYAMMRYYEHKNITQAQIFKNKYELSYMRLKRLYNFKNALYISAKANESFSSTNY